MRLGRHIKVNINGPALNIYPYCETMMDHWEENKSQLPLLNIQFYTENDDICGYFVPHFIHS